MQDVWVFERFELASEQGRKDITAEVVDGLTTAGEEVDLPGEVRFLALDTTAHIADQTGQVREDLEVVPGIIDSSDGRALQVIATPLQGRSVTADDVIVLDLNHVDAPAGAPIIASFAFGQGLPAEVEPDVAGAELLAARMEVGNFQWFAENTDGELTPGILHTLGMLPETDGTRPSSYHGSARTGEAMYWEENSFIRNVIVAGASEFPQKPTQL